MELDVLIGRTQEIRESLPLPNVKQRMAAAAQELSMAGNNQARVELLQESVLALTTVLYECDPDGTPANIDTRTHRILLPVPWGKAGWKRWGLRDWEAGILRQILIVRGQMRRVAPLFDYNAESRTWHIDLHAYPRLDLALMYWKSHPILLKDWRLFADAYRAKAHERTLRRQGRV